MALGILACGDSGFNAKRQNKGKLDFALHNARQTWPYAAVFPQAGFDNHKGKQDPTYALQHVSRRRQTISLFLEDGEIRWRGELFQDGCYLKFAAQGILGDVPLAGWRSLASDVLKRPAN